MDTEKQLADTRKDFEQFAYVVSHDLQEQVRNITNYTGLIEKQLPQDEDLRFYMSVVTGSAAKLNEQLAELLAYSRIGRNKQMEPVNVRTLIDDVIQDKDVVVSIGPMPEIMGNPAEMKILFENLLGNAMKFNAADPPEIAVFCTNNIKHWEFSIKDNGIGIAANHLQKIFGMFQRLNPEEDYLGNGAGLAICKKIINGYNGEIWAESEPGKGSLFYFTIPIME